MCFCPQAALFLPNFQNMRAAIVMKPVDVESIKRQWNLKMKNREEADIPGTKLYHRKKVEVRNDLEMIESEPKFYPRNQIGK